MTSLLCVIGNPISHSLSPVLFNETLSQLGIEQYYYFASLQTSASLKDFFIAVRNLNIRGISVTIPFKTEVIPYLDEISENAKNIGAVNTIVNTDGHLYGDNTDLYGIIDPIQESGDYKNKKIGILGAGGASLAAIYAAKLIGASINIFARNVEKAEILKSKFDIEVNALTSIEKLSEMDILINTTSVGMIPNIHETPIPKEVFSKNMLVFDAVYRPRETLFIKHALEAGAKVITGDQMFVHQAKHQFLAYTGISVKDKILSDILQRYLDD